MLSFKMKFKKIFSTVGSALAISFCLAQPAHADDAAVLTLIWQNTVGILAAVNDVPNFIANWINPDTSKTTSTIQSYFAKGSQAYQQEYTSNADLQTKLMKDFFGDSVTTGTMPYANDLAYISLRGGLYFNPDPRKDNSIDPAYNYTKFAAGLNITHPFPATDWRGGQGSIDRYKNYYNTITAVQSFSAWVLGQDYSGFKLGFPLEQQQWNLLNQASNSDWFQQVASESIGIVLRQILMYDSQVYVLLTQMIRTQREQLTAQAMTNTLLVLINQTNEDVLARRAQGTMPTP